MDETSASLAGRSALVSGSARNIGRAIALGLARRGADVLVHGASDRDAAEAVAGEVRALGVRAAVALGDLADEATGERLVASALDAFGRLDILVCNAAIRRQEPFLEMTFEQWRQVMSVDLDGVFLLARAAAGHIVEAGGGSIVCLGGSTSHMGAPARAHVCAAKMGVVGLARVLASELGPHGVNVNVVAPGHIDTARGASAGQRSAVATTRPMARMGTPEEIAAMVCHLCTPEARYVTGQTIHVNGGMLFAG